jgi:SOS-response transcriptional repressor LexA
VRDDLEQREEPARTPQPLTDRQRAALDAIIAFKDAHDGESPTLRELAAALDLADTSTNGISEHLQALEIKGWIVRDTSGTGRRRTRRIKVLHRPPAAFVRGDALLVLMVLAAIVLATLAGVRKVDGFAADVRDARDNARTCAATLERAVDRIEHEKFLAGELACRCWSVDAR